MQSNYEVALKNVEEIINEDTTYETFITELERITRPLTILQNNISLLSCVKRSADFDIALHEASDTINFKHEFSATIKDALVRFEKQFKAKNGEEKSLRAIQYSTYCENIVSTVQ